MSTVSIGTIAAYWKAVSDWVTGATTSKPVIQGAVADSAAKAGNPLQIGGIYSTTPATRHDGDAVAWEMTSTGSGLVSLSGSNIPDDEPVPVKEIGNKLTEQQTEADDVAGVLTFTANIAYIEIYNTDATNAGIFTINGIDINVPAGKVFKSAIGGTPSANVTITGATTYIVSRYV